jgi:hypothetical protein
MRRKYIGIEKLLRGLITATAAATATAIATCFTGHVSIQEGE